jgi:hypothetical protein
MDIMTKTCKEKLLKIAIFFLIFLFFFTVGAISLDPDFGWHLTGGDYILKNGIAQTDPFSYTMPSFPFVDHEWLTNVLIARAYPILGQTGLPAVYALIATLAIITVLWDFIFDNLYESKVQKFLYLIPAMLGAGTLLAFFGVRPQIESWLLLAILYRVLSNDVLWKKFRVFVPILILLWTNLHGSFALSVVIILIFAIFRSVRLGKVLWDYFAVFIAGVLVTFINPYGVRLWGEVWMQLSDSTLRWRIMEWMPPVNFFNLCFIGLLTLSVTFVIKYRRKIELEFIALYGFLLFQGLMSSRHIPLWTIITMPIIAKAIILLFEEVGRIKFGKERFMTLFKFLTIGIFIIFVFQGIYSSYSRYFLSERYFYPKDAVEFLKENLPQGQIYSEYGWGGYLIWKLPEKRVFIDGRMPSWRWKYQGDSESAYAMDEYWKISTGDLDYKEVFKKYGITMVLWATKKPETEVEKLDRKVKNFFAKLYKPLFNEKNPDYDLIGQLQKDGWTKIYGDATAEIYEKE